MASRAPAEPAPRPAEPSRPCIQTALQVSQPGDAAEREAVATARKVVTMRRPTIAPHPLGIARAPAIPVPRPSAPSARPAASASARTGVPSAIEGAIRAAGGSGAPLGEEVRRFTEPRFRADFSRVRIHTDARAASLATRLGARAFTYGRDIFFNTGQYAPQTPEGMELLAHELTHTIQQREAVQREADVTVRESGTPQVQRSVIGDAIDWIADHANMIPGFRLFTLVLGVNPVNGRAVDRSAANILRALVEFLPGGALIVEALDRYGVFDRAGGWIEAQFRSLGMVGSAFRAALMSFLDSLGITDIFSPGDVWSRARRIFTEPVDRLLGFARGLVGQILTFIREAILRPLGTLVANTRGYDLLRAVLGQDPVTGEAVPRTAETLLGGFMRLIGQDELWQNIQRSGAIPRAWAWFQNAIGGLMGLVTSIPGRFTALLASLEITDLVIVTRALGKVAGAFASFVGDFIGWGMGTVINLLQIIVEVVAPGVMPYIRRAAGAFETILRNPVAFVRTLVSAAMLGFRQFAGRFLAHLRGSLVGWLTGAMAGAGVYVPQGFTLREILRFALSVVGLTWANIRAKLVRATSETVVRTLETGFDIVRTLVTEGPAAAWQQIVEGVANLRDMVIEQVMEFVRARVVQAAVTRLLSLLTPAGAFIQAIIAAYNTVMFFVERLRQIAQVAASFIDSLATIAAGTIAPAANRVERTMVGLLTLVISFLARIAGLGRVSDAVVGIINRVRLPIDRALDRVVAWIVAQARRAGRLVASGASSIRDRIVSWWRARRSFSGVDGSAHSLYFAGEGAGARLTVATGTPMPVAAWLTSIQAPATASPNPAVRRAYAAAVALVGGGLARDVAALNVAPRGSTAAAPTAQAIDALNRDLEQLAGHLALLMPLDPRAAGATPPPGSAPVAIGAAFKVTTVDSVAVVVAIGPLSRVAPGPANMFVTWRRLRPRGRPFTAEQTSLSAFISDWGTRFEPYLADPREFYMGPTPSDRLRPAVRRRMIAQGRYNPATSSVIVNRDASGRPLPPTAARTEVPESQTDMGHLVDAVTWWNSNGRLTFPQSPSVLAFMAREENYELEPSAINQLRGRQLAGRGIRYLPPVV
jgi:hypothetical protein